MDNELLAFLAIVAEEDLRRGITEPSYVLCRTKSPASGRTTGYVVVKGDNDKLELSKLIFNQIAPDNEFIHFMSRYRAREYNNDERTGGKRKKYMPVGALFWFPCDEYGNRDMSQPPLFIKKVPDRNFPREGTKQILEAELAEKETDKYKLVHNPFEMDMLPIEKKTYEKEKGT